MSDGKAMLMPLLRGDVLAGDVRRAVEQIEADALDAERARVAVLERALQRIAEADEMVRRYGAGNTAQRLGTLLTATFKARAALAVLPVDRVGVEPLDVPAGKADWGPLGESGVGVVAKIGLNVERLAEVLRGRTAKSGHILPPLVYGAGGARFMDPDEFAVDIAARLIESPTEGET